MAPSAEIDPRVARTRRDVLAAAREVMLEEGWERVTLARVAERSGYARTTLYRHWPQRLDLLRDLIGEEVRLLHTTPAGDLREDLIAEMEAFQAALTTSGLGRMMIAIGQQARDDPEVAELNRTLRAEGSSVLDDVIESAVRRGELRPHAAGGAAVAMLVGPVLFRYLFESDELTSRFVEEIVDRFVASFAVDT